MDTAWKDGLEDVIAARSAICQIDGAAGRLYYRGYEIGDLARATSFEQVTYLFSRAARAGVPFPGAAPARGAGPVLAARALPRDVTR
jgi:citrate synthase